MNKQKILIVDDDRDLSGLLCDMLEDEGYEVTTARDLEEAYALLETKQVHLILLDINLPDGTGFELCRELRANCTVPVLFASARTSENDKLVGLELGGDDYLEKPFSLKILLAKIRSLLRRAYGFEKDAPVHTLQAGADNLVCIDTARREVKRNGESVPLAGREYDLLLYLAEHRGEALKKETLVNSVWGAFSQVEPQTLTVHIRWLREKLEKDPSHPVFIKTVWGVGYLLEESGRA
ncbi:MAG: response regulator transcription factor [Lachnospiraceae bacterium]|nr:response regulator transcription factor [Lachnospiraceae bacterium]